MTNQPKRCGTCGTGARILRSMPLSYMHRDPCPDAFHDAPERYAPEGDDTPASEPYVPPKNCPCGWSEDSHQQCLGCPPGKPGDPLPGGDASHDAKLLDAPASKRMPDGEGPMTGVPPASEPPIAHLYEADWDKERPENTPASEPLRKKGDWRKARGAIKLPPGMSSVDAIRAGREGVTPPVPSGDPAPETPRCDRCGEPCPDCLKAAETAKYRMEHDV